jgi:hypothetical protein
MLRRPGPQRPCNRCNCLLHGVSNCNERTAGAPVHNTLCRRAARGVILYSMVRYSICTLAAFAALAGCASLGLDEHANMLRTALQDDQACIQQGQKYPDPVYVTCRMQLQDDRLHQAWLNLQLMHQTANQPNIIPAPYTGHEVYRPLDRDHFDCQLITENKHYYVLCNEDEKDQKP